MRQVRAERFARGVCIMLILAGTSAAARAEQARGQVTRPAEAASRPASDALITKMYPVDVEDRRLFQALVSESVRDGNHARLAWQDDHLITTGTVEQLARIERILVEAREEIRRSTGDRQIRVIQLKYAKAADVLKQLKLLPIGQLSADVTTNALILTATPDAYKQAIELIQQLDVPGPDRDLTVYQLRHVKPEEAVQLLQNLGLELTAAADERTGSVVVQAADSVAKIVESLLYRLDDVEPSEGTSGGPTPFEVIKLEPDFEMDDAAEEALRVVLEDDSELAVDKARKLVIVKGSALTLGRVQTVLEAMQKAAPVASKADQAAQRRVRLVWLVGHMDGKPLQSPEGVAFPSPPEDLKPVIEALDRVGIGNLSLVAHVSVATSGGLFETSASPLLPLPPKEQMTPLPFRFSGQVRSGTGDRAEVSFTLKVESQFFAPPGVKGNAEVASFQTTVSAPFGRPVVLGSAPIGQMNSVFVLQVLPEE